MRQLGAKVIITPKEGEQDIDSFILYHHLMIFMSSRTEPFLLEFDVMLTTGKGTGMVEKAKELADKHGWFLCHQVNALHTPSIKHFHS